MFSPFLLLSKFLEKGKVCKPKTRSWAEPSSFPLFPLFSFLPEQPSTSPPAAQSPGLSPFSFPHPLTWLSLSPKLSRHHGSTAAPSYKATTRGTSNQNPSRSTFPFLFPPPPPLLLLPPPLCSSPPKIYHHRRSPLPPLRRPAAQLGLGAT